MDAGITFILAGILAFVVVMYVLLDGFDLGVGILFPFMKHENDRDLMMNSITPVWDGNETWLVLGGATLYGAFPMVYSTILPTLYLPLFLMLIALVFRGVSFEFRHMAQHDKRMWNICFTGGSIIAAFCQGIVLGTFVQGYDNSAGELMITDYQWLTPFSLTTGIAVIFGYALLGSAWLIQKTEGDLQNRMYEYAKKLLIIVSIFMLIISIWTPFADADIVMRWFVMPNIFVLAPLPIFALATIVALWTSLKNKSHERRPFILAMLLFLWPYLGFLLSVWPYAIPHTITVWDAAAPYNVQVFILCGLAVVIPVILAYTLYSYSIFKGKAKSNGAHYS